MMVKCMETKKVFRPYDPVVSVAPPFGDVEEKEFRLIRDSSGNCEYVELEGARNISDYVESFKNGCSLKAILDRCQMMPVRDKIAYLNQTENGLSADLSCMPKDGTEAQIMIQRVKNLCPDFAKRLREGESFEKILLEYLPNGSKTASPGIENKPESEVTANG